MSQQTSEAEDLGVRHRIFEELYDLVDTVLRGLGVPEGITPQPEETVTVALPPASTKRCRWELCDLEGFYMADNKLVRIDIAVSPWRTGKNKGKRREEVALDITWEDRKLGWSAEKATMSRKIIFTAAREKKYRDLWVNLPELKLRWSMFHGFVKYDLGGAFVPGSLPPGVDEVTETMLTYSLGLTVTGMIQNLKKLTGLDVAGGMGGNSAIDKIIRW